MESIPEELSIVVAEDDPDLRTTFTLWCSQHDWQVDATGEGETALRKVDESVDVLVLDRRMPDLSGSDVLERLPQTDFDGKVIVVTAHEPDDQVREADVDIYLQKPIYEDDFVEAVTDVSSFERPDF